MKQEIKQITLPEGNFNVKCDIFNQDDLVILQSIYRDWRALSEKLSLLNARSINLPEGLSEVGFCVFTGAYRLNNSKFSKQVKASFDAFNPIRNRRIQIKACSVRPDLTSFGPNSVWDDLYFLDFYREGKWDGTFDVYHIPNELIYNQAVNKKQKLQQMQVAGKRPRFSIYKSIILEKNILPVATFNFFDHNTILNYVPTSISEDDSI